METLASTIQQAVQLRRDNQFRAALQLLLSLPPAERNEDYYFELGFVYYRLGNVRQAAQAWERNLSTQPDNRNLLLNLGACYNDLGQNPRAIALYEKLLSLYPDTASAWSNLAKALHDDNEHESSIYCYQRALKYQRKPQDLRGLALAWRKAGRYDRSQELLDEALRLNPDDERSHFGMAMNCFYQEQYEEGVREFEWRLKLPKQQAFIAESPTLFTKPQYDGESLKGKTLLIWTEQGFGDALQYARFLPLAIAQAEKVVMWCRPGLGRLFKANFSLAEVAEDKSALPEHDYHLSLMSLPRYFDPRLELLENFQPYLAPVKGDKAIINKVPKKKNIGIVWGAEQLGYEYANKKVPLEELAPLFDLPGMAWHSLQVGDDAEDLKTFEGADKLQHHGDRLTDFADTARAIQSLDLVISVDTSVAHLAGAMGKPLWVMLHKNADWRWHSDDGVGRWYPCASLYRQKSISKWQGVVSTIIEKLKNYWSVPKVASLHARYPKLKDLTRARLGAYKSSDLFWSVYEPKNFGDWIGPYLYKKMTGKEPNFIPQKEQKNVRSTYSVGSILRKIVFPDTVTVWGSGIISTQDSFARPERVLACRGHFSAKRLEKLNYPSSDVFGDPAILLPLYYQPQKVNPKGIVGFIPHYIDHDLINEKLSDQFKIIDVTQTIEKVIDDIVSCEYTLSSSLHGLIVSHAYGVKSIWISSIKPLMGDGIKFLDYFSSFNNKNTHPLKIDLSTSIDQRALIEKSTIPDLTLLQKGLLNSCPY